MQPPSDQQYNKHITDTHPIDLGYDTFLSNRTPIEQNKISVKQNISTSLYSEIKTETVVTVQSNKQGTTFTSSSTPASYIDIHHIPVSVQDLRQHHSGPSSSSEMIQLAPSQNIIANQLTSQNILANQQSSSNIVANQLANGTEVIQMMDGNSQVYLKLNILV